MAGWANEVVGTTVSCGGTGDRLAKNSAFRDVLDCVMTAIVSGGGVRIRRGDKGVCR